MWNELREVPHAMSGLVRSTQLDGQAECSGHWPLSLPTYPDV
jgi:hypothetical protein